MRHVTLARVTAVVALVLLLRGVATPAAAAAAALPLRRSLEVDEAGGVVAEASYVVVQDAGGTVTAVDGTTGAHAFSGTNASDVISSAIASLPRNGGLVLVRAGVYMLTAPIVINHASVELRGENAAGDSFFTADSKYHGFTNKTATVFVRESGDAVQVGTSQFVFGVALRNFGVTGVASDARVPDLMMTQGSGIRAMRVDTFRIDNVEVIRKEYGVRLGPEGAFAYDNVQDVVTINNLLLSYNGYGLFADGWVANVRIRNLNGFLNQWGLLYKSGTIGQYDWLVDGVTSQADSWNVTAAPVSAPDAAPIRLGTTQELVLSNAVVEALKGTAFTVVPLIRVVMTSSGTANQEWYRGHVKLEHITLFSTLSDALRVQGTGFLDVRDLHAGSTGSQAFTGGNGTIAGHIVNNMGPNVDVRVRSGFVNSALADKASWFVNVTSVTDMRGFNPAGLLRAPFHMPAVPAARRDVAEAADGVGAIGMQRSSVASTHVSDAEDGAWVSSARPQPGAWYQVSGVEVMVSTQATVSIADASGAVVVDSDPRGLIATRLPVGFRLRVHSEGAVTVAAL